VCAALLGSYGIRTLAIDRARAVYEKPRAFALDHEIMRVFQNLGSAAAVAPHTAPFTPSEYYGVNGQLIKRLGSVPPPYPLGWPPNMVFTQPPVEAALRAHAGRYESVQVRLGTELTGLRQEDDRVVLRLQDDAGKKSEVSAGYLVGCDGASSTVRQKLGLRYEDLEFDEPWLVVDLIANERGLARLPGVSIQYCEPARPSTYLIGPGAHRRWEIMLLPGEDPAKMETEAEVWRLLARWLAPGEAKLWRVASYRFHALVAREWRRGRAFIAGDAAHQQPPFTGQGMCQGVRDVANLAWKLRLALEGRAGDALLDTYAEERGPHVRRLTTRIKEIGRLICERDPGAAAARDRRLLEEAGGSIRTMPRQQLIPALEGGFVSPAAHPANGSIFPQPRVRHAGGEALLDEVAGAWFRLVVQQNFAAKKTKLLEAMGIGLVRIGAGEGCLEEADGILARWFEKNGCTAALVRPDHYVYGVAATPGELDRQLEAMRSALQGKKG
jgi:3-(3-hydroxy-phenyl)propionate hydroxylase